LLADVCAALPDFSRRSFCLTTLFVHVKLLLMPSLVRRNLREILHLQAKMMEFSPLIAQPVAPVISPRSSQRLRQRRLPPEATSVVHLAVLITLTSAHNLLYCASSTLHRLLTKSIAQEEQDTVEDTTAFHLFSKP
jgi:hypothetical protein